MGVALRRRVGVVARLWWSAQTRSALFDLEIFPYGTLGQGVVARIVAPLLLLLLLLVLGLRRRAVASALVSWISRHVRVGGGNERLDWKLGSG